MGCLQLLERPALCAILVGVVELLDLRVGHRRQELCRLLRDVLSTGMPAFFAACSSNASAII